MGDTAQSEFATLDRIFAELDDYKLPEVSTPVTSSTPTSLSPSPPLRGFITGYDLLNRKSRLPTLTTGCDAIDDLLHLPHLLSSGIRLGETYEFAGESRSGKTQLLHQLALTCQLPRSMGGLARSVLYLDTDGNFSPARLTQLIPRFQSANHDFLVTDQLLEGISIARLTHSSQFLPVLAEADTLIRDSSRPYGLLLVDSVTRLFRAEYTSEQLVIRQQDLQQVLNFLSYLAITHNIAVVVTNQVAYSPQTGTTRPIGGHTMAHWAHHRMQLSRSNANRCHIHIINSPVYPEGTANFTITDSGVTSSQDFSS